MVKLVCAATAGLGYDWREFNGTLWQESLQNWLRETHLQNDGFACWEAYGGDAVSDQAGFLMTWFVQVPPSCISTLGYQFGKRPNLTFKDWQWDMKPES